MAIYFEVPYFSWHLSLTRPTAHNFNETQLPDVQNLLYRDVSTGNPTGSIKL
jgi:hypothetical protein